MKSSPESTLGKLLDAFKEKILFDFHAAFPCSVVSFDEVKMTATVQPLIRQSDDAPAVIQNVQALGWRFKIEGAEQVCKPSLKQGDVVFVAVADTEIKNAMTGQVSSAESLRRHDRNDAVIVGVFGCSL